MEDERQKGSEMKEQGKRRGRWRRTGGGEEKERYTS